MKVINYKGVLHTVPNWVNYVVTDPDGTILGFNRKPHFSAFIKEWVEDTGSSIHSLGSTKVSTLSESENSLQSV